MIIYIVAMGCLYFLFSCQRNHRRDRRQILYREHNLTDLLRDHDHPLVLLLATIEKFVSLAFAVGISESIVKKCEKSIRRDNWPPIRPFPFLVFHCSDMPHGSRYYIQRRCCHDHAVEPIGESYMAMVKYEDEKDLQRKICVILNKVATTSSRKRTGSFATSSTTNIHAYGEVKTNGKFAPHQILYGIARDGIKNAEYIILAMSTSYACSSRPSSPTSWHSRESSRRT